MKVYSAIFFFLMSLISSTRGQQATCIFKDTSAFGYLCRFVNVNVTDPNQQFVIGGVHLPGRTDNDVFSIQIETSVFNYFPQQIFDRFQRISFLDLDSYQLIKLHQPWRNCDYLTSLTIRGNKLQRIPGRIFAACTNLDRISIGHESHLTEIDDQAFAGMSGLRTLTFHDLQAFSELRADMFQEIPSLFMFTMLRTGIKELPSNFFRSLRSLMVVEIKNTQLTTIHSRAFNDLPLLQTLRINGNVHLKNIQPEAFVGLPNLRFLEFQNGNLTELRTNSFTVLPNLEVFNIRSNGLAKVKRNFFDNFPNIQQFRGDGNECTNEFLDNIRNQRQELYRVMEECFQRFDARQQSTCIFENAWHGGYVCRFVNANITNPNQQFVIGGVHLPGKSDSDVAEILTENCIFNFFPLQIFDRFQNIRSLELNSVELMELHQPWRNCDSLFQITFSGNRLQRIPGRIFAACKNLYRFSIEHESNLTEIDDQSFAGLSRVATLSFRELPALSELRAEVIQEIPSLVRFSIIWTNVQELPSNIFRSLRSLMVVEIMNNQLITIQSGAFNDLPSLQVIIIDRNLHLSNIEQDAFVNLPNLRLLVFQYGNLSELRTNSFSAFPSLEVLDINANGLARVERNFFENFPNLQELYATYGNECINETLTNIPDQRQELYRVMEECFQRFDDGQTTIPPTTTTTSTEAPTTTEETTTLGASTITLSFGLILSCILIIKISR